MRFVTSKEYAKIHGITVQRVRELLAEQRIPGVIRTGRSLLIPADAPLPAYGDKTTYKYESGQFLSMREYCKKHNVSKERVKSLYAAGELPAVIESGGRLFFPADYSLPQDRRIRSGQYIGWRERYKK